MLRNLRRGGVLAAALAATALTGPAAVPAAAALPPCHPDHCYALSRYLGTMNAVGVDLWTNCLHVDTPANDFATHELWLRTNAAKGVTTWIEVGLIRGGAAGAPNREFRWFWGDLRSNTSGFFQHVIKPGEVNTTRNVSIYYAGDRRWNVFLAGSQVGSSAPNGTVGVGADTGAESTTPYVYVNGRSNNFQFRTAGGWHWALGTATREAQVYNGGITKQNSWESSRNRHCTAAAAPVPAAATTVDAAMLSKLARQFSAANGEAHPAGLTMVRTSRLAAQRLVAGGQVNSDQAVYQLELHGNFTGHQVPVPSGASAPRGNTLVLTVDATTGEIVDWGITSTASSLGSLGRTVRLAM
jgi:hypothetical protein